MCGPQTLEIAPRLRVGLRVGRHAGGHPGSFATDIESIGSGYAFQDAIQSSRNSATVLWPPSDEMA